MKLVLACALTALVVLAVGSAQADTTKTKPEASTASTASDVKKLKKQVKSLTKIVNYTLSTKVRTVQQVWADSYTNATGYASGSVACPAGSVVSGGGASFWIDGRVGDKLNASEPLPNGWRAAGQSVIASPGRTLRVYAMCAVR